jgi:cathepsin H
MTNKLLISLATLAVTGIVLYHLDFFTPKDSIETEFLNFKKHFNKSYGSPSELKYRFEVFKKTLERIERNNSDRTKTHRSAINKFSDLTFTEFKAQYLTKMNRSADIHSNERLLKISPVKRDWRLKKGAVNKVKNQGSCGSCWAFSTNASLETAVWQKTKKSVSLSEQELVDCAKGKYDNDGCDGGLQDEAYKYIVDNKIATEKAYPYRGRDQKCSRRNKKAKGRVAVSDFKYVKKGVNGLLAASAKQVVSVSIEVRDDFMDYASGVYSSDSTCGRDLNHGVALVGYNTSVKRPYFIVRNSWGPEWGIDGYVRMSIGKGQGTCGIANDTNVVAVL